MQEMYFTQYVRFLFCCVGLVMLMTTQAKAQVNIVCPANITQNTAPGACNAVVNYAPPSGKGSGTNITVALILGLPSGATFPVGATEVAYQVSNNEGDTDQCTFTVTVVDLEDPLFDCPDHITVNAGQDECSAIVTFDLPTATDNCGVVSLLQIGGPVSGSIFPVGETSLDFQAFDAAGNSDLCRIIVTVVDITAPTITCPNDITVEVTTNCLAAVTFTPPVGTDACSPSFTTQTAGLPSGVNFPLGTTVQTFTVTDLEGNQASCSFNVNVVDVAPPVLTCPGNITLTPASGACDAVATFATPTATDNCPGVVVTQTAGPASGSPFPTGTTTVTFTATDGSGNSTPCSFTVTVTEDVAPTIACPANITANTDPGQCSAVVSYSPPVGIDGCPGASTVLTAGIGSGGTFPPGVTTEEYTVTDASGNSATCSFTVEVVDLEAPAIACPTTAVEATAAPGNCEAAVFFSIPSFTDNCAGGSIAQTSGPASGSTLPVGTYPVVFTATDAAGNAAQCEVSLEVIDAEPPTIMCPADVVLVLGGATCEGILTYGTPDVDDNCPGATFDLVSGPASGSTVGVGVHTITFEATDASGNTATCSFTATVSETNAPTFDCPDNLSVNAAPGDCEAVVTFDTPAATDLCTPVTVTQTAGPASGSTFPAGSTPVTFTAEDEFGNTATCTFSIIVVDDSPPALSCPANIITSNFTGLCGANVPYPLPTASDACGAVILTLVSGPNPGDFVPVGTTTVTWQATDLSGNLSECSFTIAVNDTQLPELTCPSNIELALTDSECTAQVAYAQPVATDNCGVVSLTLTEGLPSGAQFGVGITTITYEALDEAGNSSTCSFTVTVTENVPPAIACPDNFAVNNDAGMCGAMVSYTPPVGTDGCPGATTVLTSGLGSGAFFPVGTTTETYTVTDLAGNTATCSFTVTVNDGEAPVIDCPAAIAVPNAPGLCSAVVVYDPPQPTDNCDDNPAVTLMSGPASGDVVPVGTSTAVYQVTDAAGNFGICNITITVEDTEPPVIACPADITANAAFGTCSAEITYPMPSATDNCGVGTVTLLSGLPSGSPFPAGTTTVTFEVVDANGLSATCSFNVTVNEDTPPSIACPDDFVLETNPGQCGSTLNYDLPIASDACGEVTLELIAGLAPGSFFPPGITTVTYLATDLSGNTAQCSFTVTVNDSEPPVFNCPNDLTLDTEAGECFAAYTFALPTATDNCTADLTVVQTEGPASGTQLPVGATTFAFAVSDAAGNDATCSYTVTVTDNEVPVFTSCPEDISVDVPTGGCSVVIDFVAPDATDNCGVEVLQTAGPESGESLAAGDYSVVFTATDAAGNTAECSFTISVNDTTAPEIACPDGFETCDNVVVFDLPIATDNCETVEVIQTGGPTTGTAFPTGVNVLTFEATDAAGNTAQCSYEVLVLPNAPRAEAGADRNICGSTTTTLTGNSFEFAIGTWSLLSGTGDIENPNAQSTQVTNLGVGANSFIWSIDPQNGCTVESDTVTITVEPGVTIDAGEDQLIMAGAQATLLATATPPGGTFNWTPPDGLSCTVCPAPVASPVVTTLYFASYTSVLGCLVTDSVLVRVFTDLPNTITPNNDGANDVWNIPGIENHPAAEVRIFNRWGNEVFSSTGYREAWDGTRNGEDLPPGSYFYIIDYKESGTATLNGTVNIIR